MKTITPRLKTPALYESAVIVQALRLILQPGQVTELRALDCVTTDDRRPHTLSGYFNDPEKLAQALCGIRSAKGIYFVPNPIKPDLLTRSVNKARRIDKDPTTGDRDIARRHWLLIDCDPTRPSGISASDGEHAAAIERAQAIREYLARSGWPQPILADSGNGAHLLYRIDEPVDD